MTALETRATLRAIIILRQSDPDIKYQVFQRLNTWGIRLNPQEIRNSAWPGSLNTMILEESATPAFHGALGITDKNKSAIYKEMRDAEFVLRFLTFRNDWESFSGGMGRRLDRFMADHHAMPSHEVEGLRTEFRTATQKAVAAFGQDVFRRWVPDKSFWRKQVLASAYDAEIFGALPYQVDELRSNQPRLVAELKKLFSNKDFRQAIDSATNTPTYFRERIRATRAMISSVLG